MIRTVPCALAQVWHRWVGTRSYWATLVLVAAVAMVLCLSGCDALPEIAVHVLAAVV